MIFSFRELQTGVPVSDENGVVYGNSVKAAQEGIAQVTLSRIFMACPGKLYFLSVLSIPSVFTVNTEGIGIINQNSKFSNKNLNSQQEWF